MWGFVMSLWLCLSASDKRIELLLNQKLIGGDQMLGKPTRYGWMIRLNDGRLIEVATEEEARELLESE